MRMAVLSDIHGNLIALEAVLSDLKAQGEIDRTWVLGDLAAFGPRPSECVQLVRELPRSAVISGNTDRYLVTGFRPPLPIADESAWRDMPRRLARREGALSWTTGQLSHAQYEYLSKLPGMLDVNVPGYGWAIGYHAVPGSDEPIILPDTPADEVLDYFLDVEGRIGFGGHTHLPMDRDLGRWRVVNVGSVGMPRGEGRACYALVTLEKQGATVELRRVAFDGDAVLTDLAAKGVDLEENIRKMLGGKSGS